MDLSSIGSAGIAMHAAALEQSVGIAMLKKTMDLQKASSAALVDSLQAAAPSFGHTLDVYA